MYMYKFVNYHDNRDYLNYNTDKLLSNLFWVHHSHKNFSYNRSRWQSACSSKLPAQDQPAEIPAVLRGRGEERYTEYNQRYGRHESSRTNICQSDSWPCTEFTTTWPNQP